MSSNRDDIESADEEEFKLPKRSYELIDWLLEQFPKPEIALGEPVAAAMDEKWARKMCFKAGQRFVVEYLAAIRAQETEGDDSVGEVPSDPDAPTFGEPGSKQTYRDIRVGAVEGIANMDIGDT